ncbi:cyclase-associated protein [Gloeophyllum trabeum ATCC 11539]|uniref:Adenylyl cyclase-associated protein n=1 Tax=Gloeophyllum trabeum (strain ATCC 11539 / FP-39264 / Madison 617) TaxID=670483 RepID=S7QG78_GLOTA|nr:cyclase-associated protein [Gloeophyllum trabeum ATCC 11539]EPQ58427.1 cyclase-associated protein [Gloeophyllum trabeum ATCC 11539]
MSGGLNSLATIIKRLEAATSRLEDLAAAQGVPGSRQDDIRDEPGPYSRSSTPAPSNVPVPTPPPHSSAMAEEPQSITAYDQVIINGKLKAFLELTRSFAGESVVEQVALVEKMFKDLREVILAASACKKPDQQAFGELLGPLQGDIEAITRLKEANRKDREWFNHLSTVAEGAPCVGWVTVEPKPGPYVKDILDSTMFYGNRVIKEFKEKDPKHAEWVRAYSGLIEELRQYIVDYHTTGLTWNHQGITVQQYKASAPASAPSGAPAPPPPPPPPAAPAPPPPPPATNGASSGGGLGAVFADLNRGEEVTKGLRKVDKSEMTHKNPALRAGGVVPASTTPAATPKKPLKPTKPSALQGKKPAKFALEGNKWMIEYQENESALTVDNTEISHTVNLFGCKNTTVQIKGKVNAVTMVNCTKTSVLVENVISSVSVTKSPSFAIQITGKAPTIQLDSTDSGQIYISKDCLDVEITTAKCSAINVNVPVEGEEEGVFGEQPIPEMLKTTVKDGKLVTTVVEHVG